MTDRDRFAHPSGDDVPEEGPPAPTWSAWEAIPVFLISIVVAGILSVPFFSAHPTTAQQLGAAIATELALGGTVLAWLYVGHRRGLPALGVPRRPAAEIAVGFALGLMLVALLVYGFGWILARILEALSSDHHVGVPQQLPGGIRQGGNPLLATVLVVIVAPICEELFFRGLVYKGLRRRFRFAGAAGVSGLIFGLAHLQEALPGPWPGRFLRSAG